MEGNRLFLCAEMKNKTEKTLKGHKRNWFSDSLGGGTDYDYIFMGHTHRMYIKKVGKSTYVNVGSCGLPRYIGLSSGYCILDTDTKKVFLRREFNG